MARFGQMTFVREKCETPKEKRARERMEKHYIARRGKTVRKA